MRAVKERLGYDVNGDGFITYNEIDKTYEEIEKDYSVKLDRRVNYMIIDRKVCRSTQWTAVCTGCNGGGCCECGGQGKVINGFWYPING